MPKAYTVPEGSHLHKCGCGFIWQHTDNNAGDDLAHLCVCGEMVWQRYNGQAHPNFIGCGEIVISCIKPAKIRKQYATTK